MHVLRLSLAILFISLGAAAHAADFDSDTPDADTVDAVLNLTVQETQNLREPVQDTHLKLLGRGIGDKRTRQSLALACRDEACTTARFVYFQAGNPQAYWVGASVAIDLQKKKQSKRAISDLIKGRTSNKARGTATTYAAMAGILFGMRGMVILMGGMTVIGAMTPWFIIGALIMIPKTQNLLYNPGVNLIEARSVDQDGWNWADNARMIRPGKFQKILRALEGTAN